MSDYIPPELIPNILTRLPVDDAVRCSSVCKSWYDLITSSSFISLHFKLSTPNQESRLLVKSFARKSDRINVQCKVHLDNQTFDDIAELQCPMDTDFRIIGSINGLLCLCAYASDKIILWNPSLRKSFALQNSELNLYGIPVIGFGFVYETNDYKVVRLLRSHSGVFTYFINLEIYELSTNSWRNVSLGQILCFLFTSYNPAVFLEGSLHWFVRLRNDDNSDDMFGRSILTFDMKNENLGALGVPKCLGNDASCVTILTFKESLCLIEMARPRYDIWVMKEYGVPDSWTMLFRIDKGNYILNRPLCFRENGETLSEGRRSMLANNGLVSRDLTNDQVMNIGNYEKNFGFRVTTYMESLALIKSPN